MTFSRMFSQVSLLVLLGVLTACGTDADPSPSSTDATALDSESSDSGSAGTADAATVDTGADGLTASDDTASGPACDAGTENCTCVGTACGNGKDGQPLLCSSGTCVVQGCVAGAHGCGCKAGGCALAADTCTDFICQDPNCTPATKDCRCLAGSCGAGLICLGGKMCVDSTGYEGGACASDGSCKSGNLCDKVQGICQYCALGSLGCQTKTNGSCNTGLGALNGVCHLASLLPPKSPKCYTPCTVSFTAANGKIVPCIDKLREGCDANKTCNGSECLAPGEKHRVCSDDSGCMEWQVCMVGGCYSNCEATSDCQPGSGCFQHACRQICTNAVGSTECPAGSQCKTDGTVGYCVGNTPASPVTTPTTIGQATFHVTKNLMLFTNVSPKLSLQIEYPNAQTSAQFTIRKVSHRRTLKPIDDVVKAPGLDPHTHALVPCKVGQNCAMPWVTMSTATQPGKASAETLTVTVEPNCVRECEKPGCGNRCPEIFLTTDPSKAGADRWIGEFEIALQGSGVGTQRVSATYSQRPDGQWAGTVYYFGSFKDDAGTLGPWDKTSWGKSDNSFIRKWNQFRSGGMGQYGAVELRDALTSLTEESWTKTGIRAKCKAQGSKECYPRALEKTYGEWVGTASDSEVPLGVTELPFRMNLRVNPADPTSFAGRVESAGTLQYPGNPAVKLRFETDPAAPTSTGTAATFLKHGTGVAVDANGLAVSMGGRYALTGAQGCTKPGFVEREFPWLVPGFKNGTKTSSSTGGLVRRECLNGQEPFTDAVTNAYLARANPVPDGLPLNRQVEFLDGVLIDQTDLYLVFREKFESFVPRKVPTQASAYGLLKLKRVPAQLTAADYVGAKKQTLPRLKSELVGLSCDAATLASVGSPVGLDAQVTNLIQGTGGSSGKAYNWDALAKSYTYNSAIPIHYLCEDTGLFDGGAGDNGKPTANRIPCPNTSKVVFFFTAGNLTQAGIATQSCQAAYTTDSAGKMTKPGTCAARLKEWQSNNNTVVGAPPYVKCTNSKLSFCDEATRKDLRTGKTFVVQTNVATITAPSLRALIGDAFRYKTRFMSSTGGQVGFSPTICPPLGAAANPYCYEPQQVEAARKRVDCLISIATSKKYGTLQVGTKQLLLPFLHGNFSQYAGQPGAPKAWTDGFERLYAELLVTLGDDALTAAYTSRFDLAGVTVATFMGAAFETGGQNLTGVAGSEFYKLHEATQYYQLALDRLYALGPNLAASIDKVVPDGTKAGAPVGSFHSPQMVTLYLERLTRATTQKALAWNEIATRYQLLNKKELAKRVLERAYVSSFLEAALLAQFMKDITAKASSSYQGGLKKTLEDTQKRFRSSMNNMRDVYQKLDVGADTFGYADDYVPFPALEDSGSTTNAYSSLADVAKTKMFAANIRENVALESNLTGRVDSVQFATALVNIANTYENQLAGICGAFKGDDGLVYPAIKKYADKSVVTALMGDPCGRMSGGDLHEAVLKIQDQDAGMRQTQLRYKNLDGSIEDELTRLAKTCKITNDLAASQLKIDNGKSDLAVERTKAQAGMDFAKTVVDSASSAAQTAAGACAGFPSPGPGCATAVGISVISATAQIVTGGIQLGLSVMYADKEKALADQESQQTKLEGNAQCAKDGAQSVVTINNLRRQQSETVLDAFRAAIASQTALSELKSLKDQATRLQAQQEQAEGLQINFAAAKNDPNVRLYQNDAVIEADIFFRDTLKAVYAATRAFEYFTSQTYAKKGDLYLARMISTGQNNLQDYLNGLDNAFLEYQQQFGNPDLRVITLSLKDDMLHIPREELAQNPDKSIKLDPKGVPYVNPLDAGQRTKLLREALQDPTRYDSNGYLSVPFSTQVTDLSPLTRNHKIHHIEIDIQGSDLGDNLGRVYLRMLGTGSIQRLDDLTSFYALPARTAVVNTLMGSVKYYQSGDVYSSYHLRDRPLVNTLWQLVINQRDEKVNQDIKLETLSDILVHIYYTDVTKF